MEFDPAILSRIQFALTISFHIIFPTLSIGLACYIAIMEGLWLKLRQPIYLQQAKFWIKPFAITFGMGVVSGLVLSYQFGTNFNKFSEIASPVIGPLLNYEVLTAFFLEAGFLGIMLFGWNRVSEKIHFGASVIVAVGTILSAFWILAANSWMHTPAGVIIENDQILVTSWLEVIFNPSFPYRFAHMLLASFITTLVVIASVSSYYLLKKRHQQFAKKSLGIAVAGLVVLTPIQAFVGDLHGLNTLEHQPVKVAAMEGIWETEQGAGLRLFAIPDQQQAKNDFEIVIPKLASLILTHDADGTVQGLNAVPENERPPVAVVFYSFRLMIGIGIFLLAMAYLGLWLAKKGTLFNNTYYLKTLKWSAPLGFIATLSGWYVVEVGRQPWLIQGLFRTSDLVTPLPAERVLISLIGFVVVYTLLFGVYLHFFKKLIRQGPETINSTTNSENITNAVNSNTKQVKPA
ncbi:cytochrome ubiquinol oxidase subunit I [Spartinivicinus poritis]|uniref:Cytochrome ubiquinol oxidase subunit I n=1 Tax=Spartinivicinus poritis TaxID=2994640 RepID=A0ABT5U4X7_9GAMM|nr:cytochrome ubiquinol oxidase subunit I [Spartinivicinus sp. A2-2]MDE1461405.1 cytochrome ubiquinol oxidase subunit I [Spartinivicinus sp. A2-2]